MSTEIDDFRRACINTARHPVQGCASRVSVEKMQHQMSAEQRQITGILRFIRRCLSARWRSVDVTVSCTRVAPCFGTLGVLSFGGLGWKGVFFSGPGAVLSHLPRHVTSPQGYLMDNLHLVSPCSNSCNKSSAVHLCPTRPPTVSSSVGRRMPLSHVCASFRCQLMYLSKRQLCAYRPPHTRHSLPSYRRHVKRRHSSGSCCSWKASALRHCIL